jgi:hypothetical protein
MATTQGCKGRKRKRDATSPQGRKCCKQKRNAVPPRTVGDDDVCPFTLEPPEDPVHVPHPNGHVFVVSRSPFLEWLYRCGLDPDGKIVHFATGEDLDASDVARMGGLVGLSEWAVRRHLLRQLELTMLRHTLHRVYSEMTSAVLAIYQCLHHHVLMRACAPLVVLAHTHMTNLLATTRYMAGPGGEDLRAVAQGSVDAIQGAAGAMGLSDEPFVSLMAVFLDEVRDALASAPVEGSVRVGDDTIAWIPCTAE